MIELLTAATPNGRKIAILLEELQTQYSVKYLSLSDKEQKQDWFLRLNPNGRIPAIIDHANDDFVVFESGAILIYLAQKFGEFLPKDPKKQSQVMQWLMFQMSAIGPMQGQANVFYHYAAEKIPYAINRYQHETKRLYAVLDRQLNDHEFLAGEYSIADIATFPWVDSYAWSGIDISEFENLKNWLERVYARPAVKRGMDVPKPYERGHKLTEKESSDAENAGKDILE